MTRPSAPLKPAGAAAASWAVAGQVVPLLLGAGKLLQVALLRLSSELGSPSTWAGAAVAVAVVGYGMGYRGFQRSYAPFLVARAAWLARQDRPWLAWLAPLFAAGLVHATRRRLLRIAALLASMALLSLLVRSLPEPLRATVRLGVAAGLLWGALAILALAARAAAGRTPDVPLDLP